MAKYEDIHRTLIQTSGPVGDVVTTAEAKVMMNVSHADDDALIGLLVDTAERIFESRTGRQLLTATWRQNLDFWPTGVIYLPHGPVATLTSIKYYDGAGVLQTVSSGNYHADLNSARARIVPVSGFTWPTLQRGRLEAVEITYDSGYGVASAVPEQFKTAIKAMAAYWYRVREPVQESRFIRLPLHLDAMMDAFKIWEF